MTRRFIDDIRGEILSELPDNDQALISAADVRARLQDVCDSLIQDEGVMTNTGEKTGIALTGTYAPIVTANEGQVFNNETGDDGDFLNMDPANGKITSKNQAGWSYFVRAQITVEANNNEEIHFAIGRNGADDGHFVGIVGDGVRDKSGIVTEFFQSTGPADEFTLLARAVDGSATITITSVQLSAAILPTNNP